MVSMATVRRLSFGLLVAAAVTVGVQRLSAASCSSWYSSCEYVDLYYCGEYVYENDALPDMYSKAEYYASFYFSLGVYSDPWWWARVTPFEEPGYYDSGWATCSPGYCY